MIDETLLNYANIWSLGPLMIMALTALALLLLEIAARMISGRRRGLSLEQHSLVSGLGLLAALVDCLYLLPLALREENYTLARLFSARGLIDTDLAKPNWTGAALTCDSFALVVSVLVCLIGLATLMMLLPFVRRHGLFKAEAYPLLLTSFFGMALLGFSRDLLVTFIAIEILSLPLYVLCGLHERLAQSRESSLKYFLLGAFASGFFVYGLSLVYGVTGHLNYSAINFIIENQRNASPLLVLGLALVGVGLAFKIALVPFHGWLPDVYQGAPTPVTGMMAAGVKVGVFCAAHRLILECLPYAQTGAWRDALVWFAIASMVVGNLFALHQLSLKRLLAYSAITHTGYLAVGLCAGTAASGSSILAYLVAYCSATLGAFALITFLAPAGQDDLYIEEAQDLCRSNPAAAIALAVLLLSMAGFPLTAGFIGKLSVFSEAWAVGLSGLVIVAVINSVISAYFYLRVIMAMFMQPRLPGTAEVQAGPVSGGLAAVAAVAIALTLLLGVLPQLLYSFAAMGVTF